MKKINIIDTEFQWGSEQNVYITGGGDYVKFDLHEIQDGDEPWIEEGSMELSWKEVYKACLKHVIEEGKKNVKS